jgi:hypothetical protein
MLECTVGDTGVAGSREDMIPMERHDADGWVGKKGTVVSVWGDQVPDYSEEMVQHCAEGQTTFFDNGVGDSP